MKQSYTVRIYSKDGRTRSGERVRSTTVWDDLDENSIVLQVKELAHIWPAPQFRIEYDPVYHMVRNAMSGNMVMERKDTSYACSVQSEAFWCS